MSVCDHRSTRNMTAQRVLCFSPSLQYPSAASSSLSSSAAAAKLSSACANQQFFGDGFTTSNYSTSASSSKSFKAMYSSSWETHHRAMERHLPYGITQCYLPPDITRPALTPGRQAGTRFTYPGRMEG